MTDNLGSRVFFSDPSLRIGIQCRNNMVSAGLQSEEHFRTTIDRAMRLFGAVVTPPRINNLRAVNTLASSTPAPILPALPRHQLQALPRPKVDQWPTRV